MSTVTIDQDGNCNTCGEEWTEGHEGETHYDDPME